MQQSFLRRGELVDLVTGAQDLLPLGEHVEVHGGEEGDVEEHDAEDDPWERERDIERIWKVDGEKVLLKTWNRKGSFHTVSFCDPKYYCITWQSRSRGVPQ